MDGDGREDDNLVCLDGPSWAVYYWLKVNQYMATSAFIMSLAQESC